MSKMKDRKSNRIKFGPLPDKFMTIENIKHLTQNYMDASKYEFKPVSIDADIVEGYFVNEIGEVFSTLTNRLLVPMDDSHGYHKVRFRHKTNTRGFRDYQIHRLVAWEFCKGYDESIDRTLVNHIDANRINNNYTNLEWVTHQENMAHMAVLGNAYNFKDRKFTEDEAHLICVLIESGWKNIEIFKELTGLTKANDNIFLYNTIADIRQGRGYADVSKKYDMNMKKHLSIDDVTNKDRLIYVEVLDSSQRSKRFVRDEKKIEEILKQLENHTPIIRRR